MGLGHGSQVVSHDSPPESLSLSLSLFELFSIVSINIHQLNTILFILFTAELHRGPGDSAVQQCCVTSYCTHVTDIV